MCRRSALLAAEQREELDGLSPPLRHHHCGSCRAKGPWAGGAPNPPICPAVEGGVRPSHRAWTPVENPHCLQRVSPGSGLFRRVWSGEGVFVKVEGFRELPHGGAAPALAGCLVSLLSALTVLLAGRSSNAWDQGEGLDKMCSSPQFGPESAILVTVT